MRMNREMTMLMKINTPREAAIKVEEKDLRNVDKVIYVA